MKPYSRLSGTAHRWTTAKSLMVCAVAGALLVTAACSSSSGSKPAAGGGTTSAGGNSSAASDGTLSAASAAELAKFEKFITDYPTITPVSGAAAALKGKTIWLIPVSATLPYMGGIAQGATEALTKLGASVHICDAKFLPTGVASCLETAAQQGASGVISMYNDYSLVPNSYDALIAKHIPVLIGGEPATGGKTDSPALAFWDDSDTQETIQRLLAASIIKDSGGKAKVLFIGEQDSINVAKWARYTTDYYKKNCPGCVVSEVDFLAAGASKLPSLVNAALISHPDVKYVQLMFDSYSGLTLGALQSAGKISQVKFAAAGGALDSMQRISQGKQWLDCGISGPYAGWEWVDGLTRMMTGTKPVVVPTAIRLFNQQNVAGLDLSPTGFASNKWYGDDSYQQRFLTAWGVS